MVAKDLRRGNLYLLFGFLRFFVVRLPRSRFSTKLNYRSIRRRRVGIGSQRGDQTGLNEFRNGLLGGHLVSNLARCCQLCGH
jgi:hypothetical protein